MLKQKIDQMLKRSILPVGVTFDSNGKLVDLAQHNREFLRALASLTPDPAEQAKALIEAWDNPEKMRALAALRVEQVNNYIVTESNFMSMYFEQITLNESDEPAITNETKNELRIGSLGEDGIPDQTRLLKPEAKYTIPLVFVSSDRVRYKTMDVYKGRVAEIITKTFDIASDLAFKLDRIHFNLLNAPLAQGGAFGPFGYETANPSKGGYKNAATRIFLAHSGIKTARLPKTNDIDLTANPGTASTVQGVAGVVKNPMKSSSGGKFNFLVLRAIDHYARMWGNVLPGGGRLVPTGEIVIPNGATIDLAEDFEPSANVSAQQVQEDLNRDGFAMVQYLGKMWKFIDDVTIDDGYCYPRFNLLPGRTYSKPIFDKEFLETNDVENWEERWQRKLYGATIISQYRPRALRIKFA